MTAHPLGATDAIFPVRRHLVYLNHAGVSPLPAPALEVLRAYTEEVATLGAVAYRIWAPRLKKSRMEAARLLGCTPEEIAFVKSTTAGLNNIAFGLDWKPGDGIVVEENTFPANWYPWIAAQDRFGAGLRIWPERDHAHHLEDLEQLLKRGGVRLVAATSNEFATGHRKNLEELGALCRRYGALLSVDAIQTAGAFPIDVEAAQIDFLSADSHKWLLGPEGAGIMYVRKERLPDFHESIVGWLGRRDFMDYGRLGSPPDPTARRFEEGAPNVAGFMAMGESMKLLNDLGIARVGERVRQLCGILESGLKEAGWRLISPDGGPAASGIVAVHKEGLDLDRLQKRLLDEKRIFANVRRGFLRFAPHYYLEEADMVKTVQAVVELSGS